MQKMPKQLRRLRREFARDAGAAAEVAGGAPGLFGFINNSLGDDSDAAAAVRSSSGGGGGSSARPSRFGEQSSRKGPSV